MTRRKGEFEVIPYTGNTPVKTQDKNIRYMTSEQLRYGIDRCHARLAGIMPMGCMTEEKCRKAMQEYRDELFRRGILY